MEQQQDKEVKISDILFTLGRTWAILALIALFLYFVVLAIEENKITVVKGYRVPIEREEETEDGDGG